jgi:hypothetical protein
MAVSGPPGHDYDYAPDNFIAHLDADAVRREGPILDYHPASSCDIVCCGSGLSW